MVGFDLGFGAKGSGLLGLRIHRAQGPRVWDFGFENWVCAFGLWHVGFWVCVPVVIVVNPDSPPRNPTTPTMHFGVEGLGFIGPKPKP